MKVLVIYDVIPKQTYKTIIDMSEPEYDFFAKANSAYVNCDSLSEDQHEAVMVISNAFATTPSHKQYCDSDKQREYFGKWKNIPDLSDVSGVERLIQCGFIL